MTTTRPAWAYTLPAALLLMAPFDILASLAMDIYLPYSLHFEKPELPVS
jgi:DHA1 family florfenicol/chloramphenicol resistance protein-like MFS transporter